MNARIYLFSGILLGGLALVLLLIDFGKGRNGEGQADKAANPSDQITGPGSPSDAGDGRASRRDTKFESVEEAEQALQDFDMSFVREVDPEKARQGLLRFRSIVGRIPDAYYSELAARFGKGADNDIDRYVRQMAIYQEWGREDLDAALADLSGIEDEKLFLKALQSVFVGATDLDGQAAIARAEILDIETPGEFGEFERTDLMDSIFDTWIESDPFSALQWAKQAPVPEKRRDQWINDGLRVWDEKDPHGARKWRDQQESR